MGKKEYAICHGCGRKAEYTECAEKCAPPVDARCNALKGWLSLSHWKGMGAVDYCDFCSFTCLQKWLEDKVPKIPKTFFEAFQAE